MFGKYYGIVSKARGFCMHVFSSYIRPFSPKIVILENAEIAWNAVIYAHINFSQCSPIFVNGKSCIHSSVIINIKYYWKELG
jgi:hypothetical protein